MKIKEFNMSGAYDHLFKLLIIGDSGEWARLSCIHSHNIVYIRFYKICFVCPFVFLLLPLPLPLLLLILLLFSSCIHSFILSTFPVRYYVCVLSHSGISNYACMRAMCVCVPTYTTFSTLIWIYSIHIFTHLHKLYFCCVEIFEKKKKLKKILDWTIVFI